MYKLNNDDTLVYNESLNESYSKRPNNKETINKKKKANLQIIYKDEESEDQ